MGKFNKLAIGVVMAVLISILSLSALAKENNNSLQEYKTPDYSTEYLGNDRLEGFNRLMFGINNVSNDYIIYPVNVIWASVMPRYGMNRISNIFDNLAYPKRLASTIFQGDFKSSGTESLRFLTNSTIGLAGMYDPAQDWFEIEPKNENFGQVFAKWGIANGYYLYLPFVGPTTVRNGVGSVFDSALKPESYIPLAPVVISLKGARVMDKTTNLQPKLEFINKNYADPYEITRLYYGFKTYTLEKNLDREDVFEHVDSKINTKAGQTACINGEGCKISDVNFKNFDSQGAVVDSIKSSVVDRQLKEESFWADISLWNRTFENRIEDEKVRLCDDTPKYRYRYILQRDKTAPLAIIYPAIGENVESKQSITLARILYDNGYSVLLMSSVFDWRFASSMSKKYNPGLTTSDVAYLRTATLKILDDLSKEKGRKFEKRILVGTSLGALHGLFLAEMEEKDNLLNISRYICISPPVDAAHATNTLDKFFENWKKADNYDIRLKSALTTNKIIRTCRKKHDCDSDITLPLNEDEAKMAISFITKQKLSDLVLTLEKDSKIDRSELYDKILKMNFNDYLNKYVLDEQKLSLQEFNRRSSLYSIAETLRKNPKIRILFSEDDYMLTSEHTRWLKNTAKDRAIVFSHGSHLGFLHRKEFQEKFVQEIKFDSAFCKKPLNACNK